MIHYNDLSLQLIEREIISTYNLKEVDYPHCGNLLEIRKALLNEQALSCQEELLHDIMAFNEAVQNALKQMYHKAHLLYAQISAIQPGIQLTARCYLPYDYPSLHPYQANDRQDLFCALCDFAWNPVYSSGVSFPLNLPSELDMSFDYITGMDCPPPNWNEGLDPLLTRDLHINRAFHNLFDHTNFALTDFIFIREFNIEININFEEPVK